MTVYHYSPCGNVQFDGDTNRLYYQNVRPLIGTDMSLPVFKKLYSTEDANYEDLCKFVLEFHNESRAKHKDTKPLVLDPECCKTAQFVANLKKCEPSKGKFSSIFSFHSKYQGEQRNDHGELISWTCHLTKKEAVEHALQKFYSEIHGYSWDDPPRKNKDIHVGNFTQVIIGYICSRFLIHYTLRWYGRKLKRLDSVFQKLNVTASMAGLVYFIMNHVVTMSLGTVTSSEPTEIM